MKLAALLALALATKPCPQPACEKLDDTACAAKASWVAVGKVTRLEHHPVGQPMDKDFAVFVFVPAKWEKKPAGELPKELSFTVGWCNNMRVPPADVSGDFRFFGEGVPGKDSQYLEFRPAK